MNTLNELAGTVVGRGCRRIRVQVGMAAAMAVVVGAIVFAGEARGQAASLAPERFTLERHGQELRLPYASSHVLSEEHEDVRHLAVMVHGVLRNTNLYHRFMDRLWQELDDDSLAVLSPQFVAMEEVEEHDLDERYPYWTRGGWSIGHRSRSDGSHVRAVRVSSYEMMDELLLAAARSFPNLERVTIAGHSAGGQFVNRYAAGNRVEPMLNERAVTVRYIAANPSSYVYFCEHRMVCRESREFVVFESDRCGSFNNYRYGLEGDVGAYMRTTGLEEIPEIYASRRVTYLLGEADNDPEARRLARGCAAMAQGDHRLERGQIYVEYLEFRFGQEVRERHTLATVPGVGHSAARMFGSEVGREALFGEEEGEGE